MPCPVGHAFGHEAAHEAQGVCTCVFVCVFCDWRVHSRNGQGLWGHHCSALRFLHLTCGALSSRRLPYMERILQFCYTSATPPPGRGDPLTNQKQYCKFLKTRCARACPELAILFPLTERMLESHSDSCRLCVTNLSAMGAESKPCQQDIMFVPFAKLITN